MQPQYTYLIHISLLFVIMVLNAEQNILLKCSMPSYIYKSIYILLLYSVSPLNPYKIATLPCHTSSMYRGKEKSYTQLTFYAKNIWAPATNRYKPDMYTQCIRKMQPGCYLRTEKKRNEMKRNERSYIQRNFNKCEENIIQFHGFRILAT